jgi:hypothetical protein
MCDDELSSHLAFAAVPFLLIAALAVGAERIRFGRERS